MPTSNKLKKAWVVLGGHDYEMSYALRVCSKERRAFAFKERCVEHEAKKPEFPDANQSDDEFDAQYEKWQKAHLTWLRKHPAKDSYANYTVEPVAFDDAD